MPKDTGLIYLNLLVFVDKLADITLKNFGVDFEAFELEQISRQIFEEGPEIEGSPTANSVDGLLCAFDVLQK